MTKHRDVFKTCTVLSTKKQFKDFMTLQYLAKHSLPFEEQFFIKERNMRQLKDHRNCGDAILGVYHPDGYLVAQGIFAQPECASYTNAYPITGGERDVTGLALSLMVHPSYRGQGLIGGVLSRMMTLSAMRGHTMLMAKIAEANSNSLASFKKHDFTPMAQARCPDNGQNYVYVRKPILG